MRYPDYVCLTDPCCFGVRAVLANDAARLGRSLATSLRAIDPYLLDTSTSPDTAYDRARYCARLAALTLDW